MPKKIENALHVYVCICLHFVVVSAFQSLLHTCITAVTTLDMVVYINMIMSILIAKKKILQILHILKLLVVPVGTV